MLNKEENEKENIIKEINKNGLFLSELIGKPVKKINRSSCRKIYEDFDHLYVPFLAKENRVYIICGWMDSGDRDFYLEIYQDEDGYEDMTNIINEAKQVQNEIEIQYFLGRLDRFIEKYSQIKKILIAKGYIKE